MKVAILISGGVDSSVALRLVQQEGHIVTAFYLKIWLEDELAYLGECPWQEDLAMVTAVCEQARVPLHIVSLQQEYQEKVVADVIAQVRDGKTPNPDILCNKRIKFGLFLDYLNREFPDYFDKIATGHYAGVDYRDGHYRLLCVPDLVKDQTYFLSHLSQEQLSYTLFPLNTMTKKEVRALANTFDLPNKDRKDSQGICFLGQLKFEDFLRHYLGDRFGDLIEYETGNIVGQHRGFWYYTIGQRHGIRLSGGPWYVVKKDPQQNRIFISRFYYDHSKMRNEFLIHTCNWIAQKPTWNMHVMVKMRHGAAMHRAIMYPDVEDGARVVLAVHDQGIAPGQFAVFYDNGVCLGAGIIV